MRCDFETKDLEASASCGAIASRSRLIFVGSPLRHFSYDPTQPVTNPLQTTLDPIDSMRLSRDERWLAVSGQSLVKLLDVEKRREIRSMVDHRQPVRDICQSSRSIYIWASGGDDSAVIVWDVRKHPAPILTLRASRRVSCVSFSPDDGMLAIGSNLLQFFDMRNREFMPNTPNCSVSGVAYHPSEYLLASYSDDRIVRFWDLDSFECVSQSEPAEAEIKQISFCPSGNELLAVTDYKLRMLSWEPSELRGSSQLPGGSHVLSMSANEDSLQLLTAHDPSAIALHRISYRDVIRGASIPYSASSGGLVNEAQRSLAGFQLDEGYGSRGTSERSSEYGNFGRAKPEPESPIEEDSPSTPPTPSYELPTRDDDNFQMSIVANGVVRSGLTTRSASPHSNMGTPKKLPPKTTPTRKPEPKVDDKKKPPMERRKPAMITKRSSDEDSPSPEKPKDLALRKNHHEEERNGKKKPEVINDEAAVHEIVTAHPQLCLELEERIRGLTRLKDAWRRNGADEAAGVAVESGDAFLIAALLQTLNAKSSWTLSLCARLLPRLRNLLADRTDSIRDTAVDSLRKIVNGFSEVIRMGCRTMPSIGVDVQAESRHMNAQRCHKDLLDIHLNAAFLTEHMAPSQVREFNALMLIFDASQQ